MDTEWSLDLKAKSRPDSARSRKARPVRNVILKRIHKNRWACSVLLFGLSAAFIALGVNPTTSVVLNGQLVGVVESSDIVAASVASAEAKAFEILGKECSLSDGISYRKGVTTRTLDANQLTNAILEHVEGLENLYVLTVDGRTIGGTPNRKDIEDLLISILEDNMSPTSLSASFAENTAIKRAFVAKDSIPDLAEMAQALTTRREDGSAILNIKTVEEVEYTAPVAYPVEYVTDDTMYEGQYTILREGSSGEVLVTERVTLIDGEEVNSEVSDTTVIEEPVTAVIAVGTRPRWKSTGTYIWPASGRVTSEFGYRNIGIGSAYHRGLDIGADYYEPILAADGGTVIYAGWYGNYGYLVQIMHDNGDITCYAHNSKLCVSVGEKVAQGDIIARAGDTGLSDGVHCHFELRLGGMDRVDPLSYLPER